MNLKKLEALALFYSGKSNNYICKRLSMKPRLLRKWIKNDNTKIKDMAQIMYRFKIPKETICKNLFLNENKLEEWLGEYFADIATHALNKDIMINRLQDGFSFWVDNILNSQIRKVN